MFVLRPYTPVGICDHCIEQSACLCRKGGLFAISKGSAICTFSPLPLLSTPGIGKCRLIPWKECWQCWERLHELSNNCSHLAGLEDLWRDLSPSEMNSAHQRKIGRFNQVKLGSSRFEMEKQATKEPGIDKLSCKIRSRLGPMLAN